MLFLNSRECSLETIGTVNVQGLKGDPHWPGCDLHLCQPDCVASVSRIPENRHTGDLRDASFRSSSRFPPKSEPTLDNPVTFPPGCARLATSPIPTGSVALVMTMGIVLVAFFAA